MLDYLHIKNVALIEDVEFFFRDGLNILSGETGSGKSMIIDSMNFVLGERTSKDMIRNNCDQAMVEALFVLNGDFAGNFDELGIEIEEDNSLLISRSIFVSGRVINRVNGRTVTAGMLKQISESLIDIHGQHEHQSLLNPSKHISILDKFCGDGLEEEKKALNELYREYKLVLSDLEKLNGGDLESRLNMLQYQSDEILQANLNPGEEETLFETRKLISNNEKIKKLSSEAMELLYDGDDYSNSAFDKIGSALNSIKELSSIDGAVSDIYDELSSVYAQVDDVSRELGKYIRSLDESNYNIDEIEERINLIYNLKRKYGDSVPEILEHRERLVSEISFIENSEEEIKRLLENRVNIENKIYSLCGEMTRLREKTALVLQKDIEYHLRDLEMKDAKFSIKIEQKSEFNNNGWDKVEFMISANLGEEIKPLSKIASGGEMSRVMLALKTVLSDADNIDTFVFDEIDAGISGRTAQKAAEKLSVISKKNQIVCITHLPQIAAMADSHFLIEKSSDVNKTTTTVKLLDQNKEIDEIARLIGGVEITETTVKAAREMKIFANKLKK